MTGCYGPLLLGTRELSGALLPFIEIEGGALPAEVLALVRPPVSGDGEVVLFNGGQSDIDVQWRVRGQVEWQRETLAATREYKWTIAGENT